MAFDAVLADRLRNYLKGHTALPITEKKMFGGLAFLVDDKMCVNVSGDDLMCRFDPEMLAELEQRRGFKPMVMRGKVYKGYCYVSKEGFADSAKFAFWIDLCLKFNVRAKSSKR